MDLSHAERMELMNDAKARAKVLRQAAIAEAWAALARLLTRFLRRA